MQKEKYKEFLETTNDKKKRLKEEERLLREAEEAKKREALALSKRRITFSEIMALKIK